MDAERKNMRLNPVTVAQYVENIECHFFQIWKYKFINYVQLTTHKPKCVCPHQVQLSAAAVCCQGVLVKYNLSV